MKNFDDKISLLLTTTDGIKFINTINNIKKNIAGLDSDQYMIFVQTLIEYSINGSITFHRGYTLATAVNLIESGDRRYADTFLQLMNSGDNQTEYWAVEGYAKSMGKDCYDELVAFIVSPKHQLESRSNAVKQLARVSRQCFDMNKPVSVSAWKESQLDIEQILEWQSDGYKDGNGYPAPPQHSSLENPKTAFEKQMSKLEKQLKLKREKAQDPANPSNWLSIGAQSDIDKIKDFILPHELPGEYELFLKQYSPIRCCFKLKGKGSVDVYSAADLIEGQQGYSWYKDEKLSEWPESYLVIADSHADPFCIDLSQDNSPVYFANHGYGSWEFDEFASDFFRFVKNLKV